MLVFMALQLGGDPEKRSVDHGAVVAGQVYNACLYDETAEFNQLPGALAALDLPGPHVIASQSSLAPMAGCPVALERRAGCAEMPKQLA